MLAIKHSFTKHSRLLRTFATKVNVMSPIFYVNATPHIGHLYTGILCDAVAR